MINPNVNLKLIFVIFSLSNIAKMKALEIATSIKNSPVIVSLNFNYFTNGLNFKIHVKNMIFIISIRTVVIIG